MDSTRELAVTLFEDVILAGLADDERGTAEFASKFGTDPQRMRTEVLYLKVFLVDLFTYTGLGQTQEKAEVLDAFYGLLTGRLSHLFVMADFEGRARSYMAAARQPHPKYGAAWSLGKVFASLCGHAMDAAVITYASVIYGAMAPVADLVKSAQHVGAQGDAYSGQFTPEQAAFLEEFRRRTFAAEQAQCHDLITNCHNKFQFAKTYRVYRSDLAKTTQEISQRARTGQLGPGLTPAMAEAMIAIGREAVGEKMAKCAQHFQRTWGEPITNDAGTGQGCATLIAAVVVLGAWVILAFA